ncbi:uncharacterized protein DS421_1g06870 [Arachis hypogaea]|nr:uncharacterized protein DS421_1g06870 [Arachis hypogaea]
MEEGCRKVTAPGTAEWAEDVKGIDDGPYNGKCNDDDYENSGRVQQNDFTVPEIEATCDQILPEHQKRDEFSDDEDSVEDRTLANDNEASDNESSRLNEQLLENKRVWELAKDSGAELYI